MNEPLVAAIVAGDADAFGRWLRSAERPLRDSLQRFAASVDTEAVLQEALLRVWQVAPRFVPDGKPNGLLRLAVRIARNLALSEIRKTQRVEAAEAEELERYLADLTKAPMAEPDPLLRRLIDDCRDALPDKPKLVLTARLDSHGGAADATLATRLAMTKNTFLQNYTRARKFLADCLARQGVDLDAELA